MKSARRAVLLCCLLLSHSAARVPSLELYLDSTAEAIAAGYLPASDLGKPVLLTSSGKMAHTPSAQADMSRTVTWFRVRNDGRSSFTVSKPSAGAIAEPYRKAVRDAKPADREQFVQRVLQGLGQTGFGVFDAGQLDGRGDEYSMSLRAPARTSSSCRALPAWPRATISGAGWATQWRRWSRSAPAAKTSSARRSMRRM